MTRPVPTNPRYTAFVVDLFALNPPCACSFVFITSNGHVTIPEVNPPAAPAKARKLSSDRAIATLSNGVIGTLFLWKPEDVFANCGADVDGEEANSPATGGDRVCRSCDIVIVGRAQMFA